MPRSIQSEIYDHAFVRKVSSFRKRQSELGGGNAILLLKIRAGRFYAVPCLTSLAFQPNFIEEMTDIKRLSNGSIRVLGGE